MKMRFIAAAFAIALLCQAAFAVEYMDICGQGPLQGMNWIVMAFAVAVLMISLAYMGGHALENPAMSVWAKDELFTLGISAILVVAVIGAFGASCSVALDYAGGSPFGVSYRYMDKLTNNGIAAITKLTQTSLRDQLEATNYLYIGWPAMDGKGIATHASLKSISAHKEMLIDLTLPFVASLRAQKVALQMLEVVSLAVMLPFGIVLRIIPLTREGGNILIALAFGTYVVVPAFYAMSAIAYEDVIANHWNPPYWNYCDWGIDRGAGCGGQEDTMLFKIGSMIPQAVFLPNLALVLLITCTMACAKGLRQLAA